MSKRALTRVTVTAAISSVLRARLSRPSQRIGLNVNVYCTFEYVTQRINVRTHAISNHSRCSESIYQDRDFSSQYVSAATVHFRSRPLFLQMAAAEKEAKLEAAQLQAELAQLRREREKNIKTLNQTQLHEKDWERHADMLKTAVSSTSTCRFPQSR